MNITLIQMKRIGDLILIAPVIARLRQEIPRANITLITNHASSGILPLLDVEQGLVFGSRGFWKNFLNLNFSRPDICFDFSGNDRSALLCALTRARRRITYQRFSKKALRRAVYTDFIDSSVRDRHTVDHHLDLLAALDIPFQKTKSELRLSEKIKKETQQILKDHGVEKKYALIHPGTARIEKYWTPEAWVEVAQQLHEKHQLQVLMSGAPDTEESKHREKIIQLCQNKSIPIISLAEKLSLTQLAAAIAEAQILIGVDSAPCHLSDTLECPTIALFGPTNPYHWQPRGKNSQVVTPENKTWDGPKWTHPEMKELRARDVIRAIDTALIKK